MCCSGRTQLEHLPRGGGAVGMMPARAVCEVRNATLGHHLHSSSGIAKRKGATKSHMKRYKGKHRAGLRFVLDAAVELELAASGRTRVSNEHNKGGCRCGAGVYIPHRIQELIRIGMQHTHLHVQVSVTHECQCAHMCGSTYRHLAAGRGHGRQLQRLDTFEFAQTSRQPVIDAASHCTPLSKCIRAKK